MLATLKLQCFKWISRHNFSIFVSLIIHKSSSNFLQYVLINYINNIKYNLKIIFMELFIFFIYKLKICLPIFYVLILFF